MKLVRLELENFRQYYNKQRIDFAKDEKRSVTIIHGVNGAGKTSLFTAINWCLYGKSSDNIRVVDYVENLISKEAIKYAAAGEQITTTVELTFLHNGERYVLRRSLQGVKDNKGSIKLNEADDFLMMRVRREDGQARRVGNSINTMNSILPVNVREYFLFDGEKIDNFSKPEAASQVRDAIRLVMNLEILERSQKHLKDIAQDYRRELKQTSSGELRRLVEKDENLRIEQDKAESRIKQLKEEIESARRKVTEVDQKLGDFPNAKMLQIQRERAERDLKLRRSELDSIISQMSDLVSSAYFVKAQPAINRALEMLNTKRERGEIPSNIRQQFVQDLLEQLKCICGRPLEEGSQEYNRLKSLLTHSLPSVVEDDVLETSATLISFENRSQKLVTDLNLLMKHRLGIITTIEELEGELDDIGKQLEDSTLEAISGLEKQRQQYREDIDNYNLEIGSITGRIEKIGQELDTLKGEIAKARKIETHERTLGAKLDLAQQAADALQEMYQTFADDMRLKIEAKTKEIFKRLIWKESHYQDIKLGPDFNLEVIDRYGSPARRDLSAGERQVLSLSFITAMSQISEEEAPLVMDTPFGRLSSHHRNTITENLPTLAKQLVLFVTDEELRDQALINLKPFIGAEYRLEFSSITSCTEIIEVNL